MLTWAVTFTLNRLFIVGLVLLVLHSYRPGGCQAGEPSFADRMENALSGLAALRRTLD